MRTLFPSYIRVPILFFIVAGIVEYFVDSGDKPAFIENPYIGLFLLLVLILIIAIEVIVSALENVMFQTLTDEEKQRYLASKNKEPQFNKLKQLYLKLLGSKPIEEEAEIILDHNYDGIRELDNSLPPWWVYMFYVTIFFAVFYLFKYEIFNGDSQVTEYENEMAQAEQDIAEYKKNAKNLVDINTVTLLTDAADLNAGKKVFMTNCVACHKADGGGGIGPNLTDPNWILGGGIKNVFRTVSEGGRSGKGMVSWKKEGLKPLEIAQVSSYVLSLEGTTPAEPKAPEGDIWVDESAPVDDSEEVTSENTETVEAEEEVVEN